VAKIQINQQVLKNGIPFTGQKISVFAVLM